ncbi:MAG: RNA methyltransferase [Crocinitomicaceae bacterium]|nr:RNA methyltransferase [Crocinitomicaceae bacterium]
MKKNRDAERLFVVEGEKIINELIDEQPDSLEFICTTNSDFQFNRVYLTDERGMKEISSLKNPGILLAVVRFPKKNVDRGDLIIALDGIQDPGNLGTIIRTAEWFGVSNIVCSKDTVDCFNSKVVQATMGSLFRMSIEYLDLKEYLSNSDLPIYGALLDGIDMYSTPLERKGVLVIGNEGKGISDEIKSCVTHPIFIPKYGEAESLNAAMATGIILAEYRRLNAE